MLRTLHRALLVLLAPLTLLVVLLHVLAGLTITLSVFPLASQALRNRLMRRWSRVLLRIVGVRLELVTQAPLDRRLALTGVLPGATGEGLVANHVSWLDVFAMNAAVPTCFVAKADIARWPLVGWLVALVGTLFVERGKRHAVHAVNQAVAEKLRRGETIGLYLEGTTTDGSSLLPFHANLLQPALDVQAPIRPLALQYLQQGARSQAAAFVGEMTLMQSIWNILTAPGLTVQVVWLPALPGPFDARHAAARAARTAIAQTLGISLAEPAPADTAPAATADRASATQ